MTTYPISQSKFVTHSRISFANMSYQQPSSSQPPPGGDGSGGIYPSLAIPEAPGGSAAAGMHLPQYQQQQVPPGAMGGGGFSTPGGPVLQVKKYAREKIVFRKKILSQFPICIKAAFYAINMGSQKKKKYLLHSLQIPMPNQPPPGDQQWFPPPAGASHPNPGQPGAGWAMPPAAAPGAPSTAPAAVGPGGNAMAKSPWLVMMPEPMPPAGGYEMVRLFLSSLLLLTITVINVLPCFWVDGKNACSFTKKT